MRACTIVLAFCTLAWLVAPTKGVAQPAAANEERSEARDWFWRGANAYRSGDYATALSNFERAYGLEPLPEILFNIAQCHDRLRHDEEALDAFREFTERAPASEDTETALARIEVLERAIAERTAPPPADALTPPDRDRPEPDAGPGALPWIVIAGSGAVAIGGAVLLALGQSDIASIEDATGPADWSEYQAAYDRGPLLSNLGVVMLAAGAAGIGVGVLLLQGTF